MPKVKISEYSSTANSNTDVASINVDEGCAPSGINNAIRAVMGHLKDFQTGAVSDPLTVGGVLTVTGGSAAAPAITTSGDTNTGIFFPAADTIAFSEGGTESMRLNSAGNMGLGVTPSAWSGYKSLDLQGGSFASGSGTSVEMWCNSFYNGTNSIYRNTGAATLYNQSTGAHRWYNAASGTAGNAITFTQAMTLESSGVLRVNNTSTPSGNGGFGGEIAVIGNGSNGSLFYTAASAGAGTALECTRQNDGAGIYFFRNGSAAGFINITTGAISVNNSSDYRLKENVETLSGSLAKVMQVRPVTFTWKENGSVGKSVIAHELQEVFPDVVFGAKDATNEDGSIKPQSVALGNLVPDLIAAIQELNAKFEAYKATHP